MKSTDSGDTESEPVSDPRRYEDFGTLTPLQTTRWLRLGVQFHQDDELASSSEVLACVVISDAMKHDVPLGCDSSMLFYSRSYRIPLLLPLGTPRPWRSIAQTP